MTAPRTADVVVETGQPRVNFPREWRRFDELVAQPYPSPPSFSVTTTLYIDHSRLVGLVDASPLLVEAVTAVQESDAPLAVFLLEEGSTQGELIFADASGLAYGTGHSFSEAVEDWLASATDVRRSLESHRIERPRLRQRLRQLTAILR